MATRQKRIKEEEIEVLELKIQQQSMIAAEGNYAVKLAVEGGGQWSPKGTAQVRGPI